MSVLDCHIVPEISRAMDIEFKSRFAKTQHRRVAEQSHLSDAMNCRNLRRLCAFVKDVLPYDPTPVSTVPTFAPNVWGTLRDVENYENWCEIADAG